MYRFSQSKQNEEEEEEKKHKWNEVNQTKHTKFSLKKEEEECNWTKKQKCNLQIHTPLYTKTINTPIYKSY